jgi:cation:H+ antiporter
MIGSNIFNIFGILGVTAIVTAVPVSPQIVDGDMIWMIGTTVLLLPIMRSGSRITRLEGGALLIAYVVYLTTLFRAP